MGGYAAAGEEGGPTGIGQTETGWTSGDLAGLAAQAGDTSVLTATAPVGSQDWWSQAIAEHSAGLESYTPPSSPGQPGTTQLTESGLQALSLTYSAPTFSWFDAAPAVVPDPLPPGSILFLGMDFTPLVNIIRTPILEGIKQIVDYKNGITKGVTDSLTTVFQPAFIAVGNLINSVLTDISNVPVNTGKYLSGVYDTVFSSIGSSLSLITNQVSGIAGLISSYISNEIRDLEIWVTSIYAGAVKEVSEILDVVQSYGPALQSAIDNLPNLAIAALLNALDAAVKT